MAGGRRLPPSMERLWLGELRRAHAIINIISRCEIAPRPQANALFSIRLILATVWEDRTRCLVSTPRMIHTQKLVRHVCSIPAAICFWWILAPCDQTAKCCKSKRYTSTSRSSPYPPSPGHTTGVPSARALAPKSAQPTKEGLQQATGDAAL
jgi:hypothetical protein